MERITKRAPLVRLDTIEETSEPEESSNYCLDSALPRKQFGRSLDFSTLRRKRIGSHHTRRVRNKTDMEHDHSISQECTGEPTKTIKTGEGTRSHKGKNRNVKKRQTDNINSPDMTQVKMLFPDFFPKSSITQMRWQSELAGTNYQNYRNLRKRKEDDPLIHSWLNLFGARAIF